MFSEQRRSQIRERVARLMAEIDGEVRVLEVVLDSTRQQLAFVMQKDEWPVLLGMDYLEYVSHRDEELKKRLAEGLQHRLEVAQARQRREEEKL